MKEARVMSKLICVVHYEHLGVCNEPLKLLNEETFKKLVESKDARCTLGASYFHKEQIESLPQCFDSDKHGFHRQCYQKFTNAVSVLKRKSSIADVSEKRQRRSGQFGSVLFPKICMKCKSSNYITVKGKKQQPKNLTTLSACEQVKKAATLQHDEVMLLIVANEDLIAREFKMHERCYRDYTRICTKETAQTSTAASNNDDDDSDSRFQRLCEFVEHHVIDGEQSVSIKLLTEVYGLDQEDCRLRGKVKQKLMQEFEDKLLFVTVLNNEAQVVLSKNVLTNTKKSSFFESNRDFAMKEAAKIIRNDVVSLIQSASDLPWPPTVQSLLSEDRHPPESLTNFLTCLLHSTEHSVGEEVRRHVDSLSQDIIYGISKRKFLTGKHVLLGCGLHSLTGLKKPINILARLGHCCSYNKVQEIETAQAELAQKMISLQHPLPLIPVDHAGKAPTIFWWDNFDCKKETKDGSIHTCHGVAFQEDSDRCMKRDETLEVPVSKKRTVSVVPQVLRKVKVVPHKEPPPFDSFSTCEYNDENARQILLCWKFLRRSYSESTQEIARFVGWVTACFARKNSQSTHITFLPPIRKPITDYSTVLECIIQSQRLASVSNMKYTHITVDAGAAAKFYHIIWNNPKDFENVLIHLGDFHGMMEFFSVIGKIIKGSGFEEIVYQAGLCTSGGINGVLTGKHYNRSWMVHECFAEGIERLFWESFVDGLPRDLESHLRDIKTDQDCRNIIATSSFQEFEKQYERKRNECLCGENGKTAQFWMQYATLVDVLHKMHFAINTNDFQLRLDCWKELVSLCFSTNKQNYARYGSYFCLQSENLEKTHPGARQELQDKGISVCRNNVNIRQSIDGAGEQTFMKSSKTTGNRIIFSLKAILSKIENSNIDSMKLQKNVHKNFDGMIFITFLPIKYEKNPIDPSCKYLRVSSRKKTFSAFVLKSFNTIICNAAQCNVFPIHRRHQEFYNDG